MDDALKNTPEGKEIHDIRTNADNPRYAAFQRGDKDAVDHVSSLYQKLYTNGEPLSPELAEQKREYDIRHGGDHVDESDHPSEQRDLKQKSASDFRLSGDLSEDAKAAVNVLRERWGADFDRHNSAAFHAVNSLSIDEVSEAVSIYPELVDDPNVIEALSLVGRGEWNSIPRELIRRIETCYPGIESSEPIQKLISKLEANFRRTKI